MPLAYCGERRPSAVCSRVGVGSTLSLRLEPSESLPLPFNTRSLFFSDRTCTERLKTYRFAKRGHTIQLRLGARLCRIHGRRMGNVLRMAFTQNRVRSCTGTSLSLTMRLLSHGLSPPLRLS